MKISLIIFFFLTSYSFGVELNLNCENSNKCKSEKDLKTLVQKNKFLNKKHLGNFVEALEKLEVYENLSLYQQSTGKFNISIKSFEQVNSIHYDILSDLETGLSYPEILPLVKNEKFTNQKFEQTKKVMHEYLRSQGFYDYFLRITKKEISSGWVDIIIKVRLKKFKRLKSIKVYSDSNLVKDVARRTFGGYLNKRVNYTELRESTENLKQILFNYGYYVIELDSELVLMNKKKQLYQLKISAKKTISIGSYLYDSNGVDQKDFKMKIANTFSVLNKDISEQTIKELLLRDLKSQGYLKPKINVNKIESKNVYNEKQVNFSIKLNKERRSNINQIKIKGNKNISSRDIVKLYYKNATNLAYEDIYDEQYAQNFVSILEKHYNENGYLRVKVESPQFKRIKGSANFNILYKVYEYEKFEVDEIKFPGISRSLINKIKKRILTKRNTPFNPESFEKDLKSILLVLDENGYAFARYKGDPTQFLDFTSKRSKVVITFNIELGSQLKFNQLLIVGNKRTKEKLIAREMNFSENDFISNKKIDQGRKNLLNLGLFQSVETKIIPSGDNKSGDILLYIKEAEFGSVELAPGIRSDLGLKLSTTISYDNIDGLGKRLEFQGSVNRRLNLRSLDERRREESNSLTEFGLSLNFNEKYLFDTPISFNAVISKERERFFTFDADIQSFGTNFSLDPLRWLKLSMLFQVETISQFDATQDIDHGHFQIGSLTPGIALDFRNNRIFPTKGVYASLSCEYANPNFFSQDKDDLKIDYYKLMNRNRFYIPISSLGVLALSTSFGIQENKATKIKDDGNTEGYIPNIKVFRLSGIDAVRGFEDDEINTLVSGEDISDVEINNRAYLANLKVEPRYFLNDSMILGVFYDAGRVFVNEFDKSELRSSVGMSFKFLTPVGTIDLDYGIKLLRKKDSDGNLESPGRLHLSIGFF